MVHTMERQLCCLDLSKSSTVSEEFVNPMFISLSLPLSNVFFEKWRLLDPHCCVVQVKLLWQIELNTGETRQFRILRALQKVEGWCFYSDTISGTDNATTGVPWQSLPVQSEELGDQRSRVKANVQRKIRHSTYRSLQTKKLRQQHHHRFGS